MVSRRHVVRVAFALTLSAISLGSPSAFATQEKADRFFVFGHVRNAGAYLHQREMTVGDAIDAAGGILPRGGKAIEIVRFVNEEKQSHDATFNDAVLPNDSIIVK